MHFLKQPNNMKTDCISDAAPLSNIKLIKNVCSLWHHVSLRVPTTDWCSPGFLKLLFVHDVDMHVSVHTPRALITSGVICDIDTV